MVKKNGNLDNAISERFEVTFCHYLSFTVHYKYKEISSFTPVAFKRIFLSSFYLIIFYFENFSTCRKRNPRASCHYLNILTTSFIKFLTYLPVIRVIPPKTCWILLWVFNPRTQGEDLGRPVRVWLPGRQTICWRNFQTTMYRMR